MLCAPLIDFHAETVAHRPRAAYGNAIPVLAGQTFITHQGDPKPKKSAPPCAGSSTAGAPVG